MLIKYINSNRLSVLIFISLLPAAIWAVSSIQNKIIQPAEVSGVLLGRQITYFTNEYRILASLIAFILLFTNGYMLNQLNTAYIFIPTRTQLPLFFYLLIILMVKPLHQLTPALVASSIVLLSFFRIFKAVQSDQISINFLDTGLLIAIASLFYPPAILFCLFAIAAVFIFRPLNWREPAYIVIGILLPYVFMLSFYYLLDISIRDNLSNISAFMHRQYLHSGLLNIIGWAYTGVLLIIGSLYMIQNLGAMKIQSRKFFTLLFIFFIISLISYIVVPADVKGMVYFMALPMAFLLTNYFVKCSRNWINEGMLIMLLIAVILQII